MQERESTKKLKVRKTEIEKLSKNERMLNKKKENSFRIILPSKMAEIFAFKIKSYAKNKCKLLWNLFAINKLSSIS